MREGENLFSFFPHSFQIGFFSLWVVGLPLPQGSSVSLLFPVFAISCFVTFSSFRSPFWLPVLLRGSPWVAVRRGSPSRTPPPPPECNRRIMSFIISAQSVERRSHTALEEFLVFLTASDKNSFPSRCWLSGGWNKFNIYSCDFSGKQNQFPIELQGKK